MRITFPHMGDMHIALKAVLAGLKLEVVPPPPITKRTLELGVKNSPESACMPLKINMGNFIEALEKGADTIVMVGGWGPCRFGYYAQVEREILESMGFKFKMIVLEAPDSRLYDLVQQVKALGRNVSLREAAQAIKFGWDKLNALETVERQFDYYLPRARDKNLIENIYDQAVADIDGAGHKAKVQEVTRKAIATLQAVPLKPGKPIMIGLVGEIYIMLESAANHDICRRLGRMEAEVSRSVYLSEWLNDHLLGGMVKKSFHRELVKCARPYLKYPVGGHGLETIGNAVRFAQAKYDGIIQIGPLTCTPEIVAQSILPSISARESVPTMTLWFDEISGTAGLTTRLEAFIDMLGRRKALADQEKVLLKAPNPPSNLGQNPSDFNTLTGSVTN